MVTRFDSILTYYSKAGGTTYGAFVPVGIHENTSDISVKIFPNPSNDILTITSKENYYRMEIVDVKGSVVLSEKFNNTIDISKLAKGKYLLKLYDKEQKTLTTSFIKN